MQNETLTKAQIVLSERTQCPPQISHTVAKEKVNKVIGPLKFLTQRQ